MSKKELEERYKIESLYEIAISTGFIDAQYTRKHFKKIGIPLKSKSENIRLHNTKNKGISYVFSRDKVQNLIDKGLSRKELMKELSTTRHTLEKWCEENDIKLPNERCDIELEEIQKHANKCTGWQELEDNFDITKFRMMNNDIVLKKHIFSLDETKEILKEYSKNVDISNKGQPKIISLKYSNLHDSIVYHTKEHSLKTDKITEKMYRLLNDYDTEDEDCCVRCNKPFEFSNIITGYVTPSGHCKKCISAYNGFGVSMVSQELFKEVHIRTGQPEEAHFAYKDYDVMLYVKNRKEAVKKYQNLNKRSFSLDYTLGNKIIEFDGEYWHRDTEEKDRDRDLYLEELGYEVLRIKEEEYRSDPQKEIRRCVQFLTM